MNYKDRRVLYPDYMPSTILFREEQAKHVEHFLRFAYSSEHLYCHGPRGTGKTVLIKSCLAKLPQINPLATGVYCMAEDTQYKTAVNLVMAAGLKMPSKGWAFSDIIRDFLRPWVESRPGPVVFVIDDVDNMFKSGAAELFYFLSRTTNVNTICIGQNERAPLELGEAPAGSSYIPLYINFPRYILSELYNILCERATEAFNNTIDDTALLHAAKITYHYGMVDARFAIALLRYAAGFAEEAGQDTITSDFIDKALGHLERFNIVKTVMGMPRPALAILYLFYSQRNVEMPVAELHSIYNEWAKELRVRTYGRLRFEQYLNELEHERLVQTYVKGRGHARGTIKLVARSELIEREDTLREIREVTDWPVYSQKATLKGSFGGEL